MNNTIITVERAMRDLRAGLPVLLDGFAFSAVETADISLLTPQLLILNAARSHILGLGDRPSAFTCQGSEEWIASLIDPLQGTPPLPLPVAAIPAAPVTEALQLLKYATLLPALFAGTPHVDMLSVTTEALRLYPKALLSSYKRVSNARLPLEGIGEVTVISYRPLHGGLEQLAILVGAPASLSAPPVRLHSSCLTGDILGSMRCDCGEQLRKAISESRDAGGGIVLYLNQEGRGIGIANKLRAYQLQDNGQDTYDANLLLGYAEDERDFSIAAAILQDLGIARIQLMTNNPDKIQQLEKHGIIVEKRLAHVISPNGINDAYLEAKAKKKGHFITKKPGP